MGTQPALQEPATSEGFSLNPGLIGDIFRHARPLGHHEDRDSLNLGFGFLYYGLVRTLRPRHVVVIGSGFGFSVVCLALGLKDNAQRQANARGRLSFVDPSYSVLADGPLKTVGGTSQWSDAGKVRRHFERFGVEELVTHHRLRSDQFFDRYRRLGLPRIDLAFIDGNHAYADVKHDFIAALRHARRNSWLRSVKREKAAFEVIDFPFSSGVAMVRVLETRVHEQLAATA